MINSMDYKDGTMVLRERLCPWARHRAHERLKSVRATLLSVTGSSTTFSQTAENGQETVSLQGNNCFSEP